VLSRNLGNEVALAHWGLLKEREREKRKKKEKKKLLDLSSV